ncbi:beta-Ig-H3/fasciclin [unidentified eubacterium SCB49]|nr:beta-Ig-H3/fasciclin [unidentified eubacterium SCB49]
MIFRWSLLLTLVLISVVACDETTIKTDGPVIGTDNQDNEEVDVPKVLPYNLASRIKSTDDLTALFAEIEESPIIDQLTKDKGPYTLFAPSNDVLEEMDPLGEGIAIAEVLKKYMVNGKITTVSLTKDIRANGGSFSMNTLGGTTLVAYKVGNVMYLKNIKGDKAEIGKSDIVASNGIIHVVKSQLDF